MKNPEDDWMTVDQAAHYIGNGSHRLAAKIRQGAMPSARLGSIRVVPKLWVEFAKSTATHHGIQTRIDWEEAGRLFAEADK